MKASTKRLAYIGAAASIAGLAVGLIALSSSKPAPSSNPSPSPSPTPPAPTGSYTFKQGERYQIIFTAPAAVMAAVSIASVEAYLNTYASGLFRVFQVSALDPTTLQVVVDVTGPTTTVPLSQPLNMQIQDLGPSPTAATGPGPQADQVILVPGPMIITVYAGTPLIVEAPAGGTIILRHAGNTRTAVQIGARIDTSVGSATSTAGSYVFSYLWTDSTGAQLSTQLTLRVL